MMRSIGPHLQPCRSTPASSQGRQMQVSLVPSHSMHKLLSSHTRIHLTTQLQLSTAVCCATGRCGSMSRSRPVRPLQHGSSWHSPTWPHAQRFSSVSRRVMPPLAMVNVDFASPSLVLGVTLIGCGIALLQVRNMQREVSRDADIVVAAMISIVGSTLIFQGWRLDPLLLLCQALTTSVAFWYGLEAFKLRAEVVQDEIQDDAPPGQQLPPLQDQMPGSQEPDYSTARPGYLPPGSERTAPWAQQQQQQQQVQQAGAYGPSSGARWGLPPAGQQAVPYDAFAAGNAMSGAAYPQYEQEMSGTVQQQQYMPGDAGYSSGYGNGSGFYDAAGAAGVYSQQPPGQLPGSQQQPQQYEWPPGSYGQQPVPSSYLQQQQQPGWFDATGGPMGGDAYGRQPQEQLLYGSLPGLIDPYTGAVLPAAGAGAAPDAPSLPAAYGSDGSIGLPPPADQQQQQPPGAAQGQQGRPRGSGRRAYEQVDDWE